MIKATLCCTCRASLAPAIKPSTTARWPWRSTRQFVSLARPRGCAVSRRTAALGTGAIVGTALAAGLLVFSAAAVSSKMTSDSEPRSLVARGMDKFQKYAVEESILDFDAVLESSPRMRPYLWQRGLSLYYAGRFEEGAKQFREDVAVNPDDTEEAIWAFLCEAQYMGPEAARKQYLRVGRDPRPVMRAAYECFLTGASPDMILDAVRDQGDHDTFYALLYMGLWYEAHGRMFQSRECITAATTTPYAQFSGDYMVAVAKVHCQRRGYETAAPA